MKLTKKVKHLSDNHEFFKSKQLLSTKNVSLQITKLISEDKKNVSHRFETLVITKITDLKEDNNITFARIDQMPNFFLDFVEKKQR